MRISDWSSDVCSSDLVADCPLGRAGGLHLRNPGRRDLFATDPSDASDPARLISVSPLSDPAFQRHGALDDQLDHSSQLLIDVLEYDPAVDGARVAEAERSEEHTSELQSLMRIS